MVTLKTKRLVLRELKLSDAAAMFQYAKSDKVGPSAGWRPHLNVRETHNLISLLIQEQEYWAITIDDSLIGTINLSFVNSNRFDPRTREIGFALNPNFWGQGFAKEALSVVLKYGFETINLRKIIVKHYDFNYQSASVIANFNFKEKKSILELDYKNNTQVVKVYEMRKKDYIRSEQYE